MPSALKLRRLELALLFLVCTSFLLSCGGNSSSTTPPPPPPPPAQADFSLFVQDANLSLQQQGAYQLQGVSAKAINGFKGTIDVEVSGLPSGVSIVPPGVPSFSPDGVASSSWFQVAASSVAATGTSTITVTGTSGTITHAITFPLTVRSAAPFSITAAPNSVSLTPGSAKTVQVTLSADAGTSPSIIVGIPDMPANYGIRVTSPGGLLTVDNPLTFGVYAGGLAQPLQSFPIVLTAIDNSTANTNVAVVPLTVSVPFQSSTSLPRSTFVRTDHSPTGLVYDQRRKLLFVSVEVSNEVAVFSSIDGHRVASIPVPYPAGIDESTDGSAVYVVSPYFTNITTIDPNLFQVVRQTRLPQISGVVQTAFQVAALSSGDVMILLSVNQDPNGPPAYIWNPSTNTFAGIGRGSLFSFYAGISRSADHSKILVSAVPAFIYEDVSKSLSGPLDFGGINLAISPDGSQVVSIGSQNSSTVFYDSNANPVGSIELGVFPLTGVCYSLDGTRLYVTGNDLVTQAPIVYVVDPRTPTYSGAVASFGFDTSLPFSGASSIPFAVDETNMLFGGLHNGIGYVDVGSPGFLVPPLVGGELVQPTLLSLSTPTSVQIQGSQFLPKFTYGVYFGQPPAYPQSQKGSNLSVQSSTISLMAPPGLKSGPANVTITRSDGFSQVMPDAVSYGPTILDVSANAGSASGGDSIVISGYGLEPNARVTIAGSLAANGQFKGPLGQGLPVEALTVTTPAGTPGTADVTITTSQGAAMVTGGLRLLSFSADLPDCRGTGCDCLRPSTSTPLHNKRGP